jgi:hypothetical protein
VHLVVPAGGSHRETRRIELGPRVLTIGRSAASDVHLDVPGVDEEHARISEVALIAIGADCAIGDVPLEAGSRRLVMPGDEIQIGSVVLALEGNDPSLVPPPPGGHLRVRAPKVRVVEGHDFGHQLTLEEENRLYVIGRAPSCDLVLEDREVSREHVKLVRRGYSVFIQDQSSTRGSWLGRTSVYAGSTLEWTRPRMLKVGATVLALELPEEIRRNGPPAQASAGMTPAPRGRVAQGEAPTPSAPGSSPRSDPGSQPPTGETPPPVSSASPVALPIPSSPPPPLRGPARKAWKKSGPTIGKASGLLLLALAALTILGALFVVFSLME